jgi:hypothetical protein
VTQGSITPVFVVGVGRFRLRGQPVGDGAKSAGERLAGWRLLLDVEPESASTEGFASELIFPEFSKAEVAVRIGEGHGAPRSALGWATSY